MGCAVVVRDHLGKMVVAKSLVKKGCPSPMVAEALATRLAVSLCIEMGLMQVDFEGDSKSVVDAMNNGGEERSYLGIVAEDLTTKILQIQQWKMSFIKRDGNKIAHVLAKYAIQHGVEFMWTSPPDCIRELLLLEQFALAA
jgi:ribonuclease HI